MTQAIHDIYITTTIFGMVVNDLCNSYHYRTINRYKERNLGISVFLKLLDEEMLNNLESKISPYGVYRNLPFLGVLPVGDRDACLLHTELFPGDGMSQTLDQIGVPDIDMVAITI